jgi:hypothetical protein
MTKRLLTVAMRTAAGVAGGARGGINRLRNLRPAADAGL